MTTKRLAPIVLALTVALGITGASATANPRGGMGPPSIDVQASKKPDGPYTDETGFATIREGKSKTFYWAVTNNVWVDESVTFDDAATSDSSQGYRITWYKGKKQKKNISSAVEGLGYEFNLPTAKTKYFNAVVKNKSAEDRLCLGGQAAATSPAPTGYDAAYFSINGTCV